MKKIYILAFAGLLSGCKCYNYVGSPKYVPLNTEKDKVIVNLYMSNLQLGYSVSDHFGTFIPFIEE